VILKLGIFYLAGTNPVAQPWQQDWADGWRKSFEPKHILALAFLPFLPPGRFLGVAVAQLSVRPLPKDKMPVKTGQNNLLGLFAFKRFFKMNFILRGSGQE